MLVAMGVALLALGLLSGVALVLAPFGLWAGASAGWVLWTLFPLLCLLGFTFVATQASPALVRTVTRASAGLLLLLAVGSVVGLVFGAVGLLQAPVSSAPLWFVLAVGVVLGSMGAASFRSPRLPS